MGIQSREVKQRHAVYHEAGQMLGRQTVAQPHCQIERLLVVHGFEGSTHAQQYTISDGGTASLRQTARGGERLVNQDCSFLSSEGDTSKASNEWLFPFSRYYQFQARERAVGRFYDSFV